MLFVLRLLSWLEGSSSQAACQEGQEDSPGSGSPRARGCQVTLASNPNPATLRGVTSDTQLTFPKLQFPHAGNEEK